MKAIIEYSRIKEVEIKKIDVTPKKRISPIYIQTLFIVMIITIFCLPSDIGEYLGISYSMIVYFIKFIIDKKRKEQFDYLPDPDINYVDIPYKNKLQAIDFKVTIHPETNPVRIMQDESYRKYILSNYSDSLLNEIL